MSQQDIFKKAIAAKLSGDEEGFKAAISEAIKSKTKQMLGETALKVNESAMYRGPGVEEVDKNWYYVYQPFNLPEGNVAKLPAGPYVASFNVGLHPRFGDSAQVLEVEVCHPDDDQVLANLFGDEGEAFYNQYIPQETRNWIDSKAEDGIEGDAERQHNDNQADIGYERQQDALSNADGKDYAF